MLYPVRVRIPPSPPRTVFRRSRIFRWRPCTKAKTAHRPGQVVSSLPVETRRQPGRDRFHVPPVSLLSHL